MENPAYRWYHWKVIDWGIWLKQWVSSLSCLETIIGQQYGEHGRIFSCRKSHTLKRLFLLYWIVMIMPMKLVDHIHQKWFLDFEFIILFSKSNSNLVLEVFFFFFFFFFWNLLWLKLKRIFIWIFYFFFQFFGFLFLLL